MEKPQPRRRPAVALAAGCECRTCARNGREDCCRPKDAQLLLHSQGLRWEANPGMRETGGRTAQNMIGPRNKPRRGAVGSSPHLPVRPASKK
eukprot:3269183-Heterocapsa_arctica.AAC.1